MISFQAGYHGCFATLTTSLMSAVTSKVHLNGCRFTLVRHHASDHPNLAPHFLGFSRAHLGTSVAVQVGPVGGHISYLQCPSKRFRITSMLDIESANFANSFVRKGWNFGNMLLNFQFLTLTTSTIPELDRGHNNVDQGFSMTVGNNVLFTMWIITDTTSTLPYLLKF